MNTQNLRIGLIFLTLCSPLLLSCPGLGVYTGFRIGAYPPVSPSDPYWNTPYHDAVFKATHNSYTRSIPAQLDAGFRLIEIDFHDQAHTNYGYRVGHWWPGHQVSYGYGNPNTTRLPAWLSMLSSWSQNNPGHAPITLILDTKDPIADADNDGYAGHNLSRFNQELLDAFGLDNIYTAAEQGRSYHWPPVGDLRDKFIIVMAETGRSVNRQAYVGTLGKTPAVAMNDHGQVIAVYQKPISRWLWYWTGEWQTTSSDNKMPTGSILWLRNQRYAWGFDYESPPTIAINNEGWIVATHQGINQVIKYQLGKLTPELDIDWKTAPISANSGSNPAIRFDSLDSNTLTAIYTGIDSDTTIYEQDITLHTERSTLELSAATSSSNDQNELWKNVNSANSNTGTVKVSSDRKNLLTYSANGRTDRIRLFQISFVEADPVRIGRDSSYATLLTETTGRFHSSDSPDSTVRYRTSTNGDPFLITRNFMFGLDDAHRISDPRALPNFPALYNAHDYRRPWYHALFGQFKHFE